MTAVGYVPVIDVASAFAGGSDRVAVAREIDAACRDIGFFAVTGHGVSPAVIAEAHRVAGEFFAQSDEAKQAVRADDRDPLTRGWVPHDRMHQFFVSGLREAPVRRTTRDERFIRPNRWPDIPGFREACIAYYTELESVARQLMRLVALALRLPEGWFDTQFAEHITPLAINGYAMDDGLPVGHILNPEHRDWDALTILHQDDTGGLQVLDSAREWHDVHPVPGAFLVNLGRLLARWTDERWTSTVHRVVVPAGLPHRTHRVSLAFLYQPNAEVIVDRLPTSDPDPADRSSAVRSGDYFIQMTRRAHVRRRLRRADTTTV